MFIVITLFILIYDVLKNKNTYAKHMIILDAIFDYRLHCFNENIEPSVNFDDMEGYYITFFKFWDWGYKNILSKEKYVIVKDYIEK